VHLVPADLGHRVLDGETVCAALGALGECGDIGGWAQRFRLLADPGRLKLLLCIHRAGPISVTDLAVAAGMNDTTVSQALRLLRAGGTVAARRDGRIVRYRLADDRVAAMLDQLLGQPAEHDLAVSHRHVREPARRDTS
jgi:ArsR family transcriptional regulator, lead/cadmium/zinc/bismuth-responsive transcriptional repressor